VRGYHNGAVMVTPVDCLPLTDTLSNVYGAYAADNSFDIVRAQRGTYRVIAPACYDWSRRVLLCECVRL
jgi:hypothetical protein